ncbi:MAG: ferritin-like domain-containing protein [Gemmatales bacterium]
MYLPGQPIVLMAGFFNSLIPLITEFHMVVPTVESLFEDEIKDLYSAESQLVKALPKMAKAASTPELRKAIEGHLKETTGHVSRLEKIGQILKIKLSGKKCKAMEGLLKEGKEALEMDAPGPIIDLAIIAAAQRVEHYEISGYGTARAFAEHLGHDQIVRLLSQTLDEESHADEKLTSVCQEYVLPSADQEEEPDSEEMRRGKKTKS